MRTVLSAEVSGSSHAAAATLATGASDTSGRSDDPARWRLDASIRGHRSTVNYLALS